MRKVAKTFQKTFLQILRFIPGIVLISSQIFAQQYHVTQSVFINSGKVILAGNKLNGKKSSEGFIKINDEIRIIKSEGDTHVNALVATPEGGILIGGDQYSTDKPQDTRAWLEFSEDWESGKFKEIDSGVDTRRIHLLIPIAHDLYLLLCQSKKENSYILKTLQKTLSGGFRIFDEAKTNDQIPSAEFQAACVDSDSTFILALRSPEGIPVLLRYNYVTNKRIFLQSKFKHGLYKVNSIIGGYNGISMVAGSYQKNNRAGMDSWLCVLPPDGKTIIKDTVWGGQRDNWFLQIFEGDKNRFHIIQAIANYSLSAEKVDLKHICFDLNLTQSKTASVTSASEEAPVCLYRSSQDTINCVFTSVKGSLNMMPLVEENGNLNNKTLNQISFEEIKFIEPDEDDGVLRPDEKAYLIIPIKKESDSWLWLNAKISPIDGDASFVKIQKNYYATLKKTQTEIIIPVTIDKGTPKEGDIIGFQLIVPQSDILPLSFELRLGPPVSKKLPSIELVGDKVFSINQNSPVQYVNIRVEHKSSLPKIYIRRFSSRANPKGFKILDSFYNINDNSIAITNAQCSIGIGDTTLLKAGDNTLEIIVEDSGTRNQKDIKVSYSPKKGRLYIICIAPYYYNNPYGPLQYNVEDVKKIESILDLQAGKNALFDSVIHIRCYESPNSTTENEIEMRLNNFQKEYGRGIRESDMIIFYYSGHGRINPNNKQFELIPTYLSDTTMNVNYESLMREIFIHLKCKKLLLIDACTSGSIKYEGSKSSPGQPTQITEYLQNFHKEVNGFCIVSSSGPGEPSYDGFFSKVLVDAFSSKADNNSDDWISFSEFTSYIINKPLPIPLPISNPNKVSQKSEIQQRPELIRNDFESDKTVFFSLKPKGD